MVSALELRRDQIFRDEGFEASHQCGFRRLARYGEEVLAHGSYNMNERR